ncbi:MAG: hypothetical protein K6E29_05710 [Cyanobacteria bacterium RUI128]|nr:hypothetical protein [Cyanobacteria bacterium RUI128]
MRISASYNQVSFGRNLSSQEMKEYTDTLSKGKQLAGQTDKSIFIMPTSCLPQTESFNSGIGNLSSDISQDYIKYMKSYLGFNIVEDLPPGQASPFNGLHCAYTAGAYALGNQQINPELLSTKEFENLLTKEDLKEIADGNTTAEKNEIANFRNAMDNDGAQNRVLKRAHERFQKLEEINPLKQKYNQYIKENEFWLNIDRVGEEDKDFFKFKQFIGDEHLRIGKEKLNKQGLKLCGDCLIGFSSDEVKAYPNAFTKDGYIGMPEWKLPALNYKDLKDENSDAYKVLKNKIQLFAKRYDMIRFDVAWAYVTPLVTPKGEKHIKDENKIHLDDSLLKTIDGWIKEVKGQDYDTKKNLIYEFDAGVDVFSAFGNDGKLIPPLRDRVKVYGNTYMHEYPHDKWGYNEAFLNRGWSPDEFILGVGNHDPQPLRQIAKDIPEDILQPDGSIIKESHKQDAIPPLSRIFGISHDELQNPTTFAKAKWAEPMMAKNTQMFYMDVFGREERFDMQGFNTTVHPEKNYGYKVPTDFRKAYMDGIAEGFGFNPMDSLEKVFRAKGLDKSHPELFDKIVKFKEILLEPEQKVEIPKPVKNNNMLKYGALAAGAVAFAGAGAYFLLKNKFAAKPEPQKITAQQPRNNMRKFLDKNSPIQKG